MGRRERGLSPFRRSNRPPTEGVERTSVSIKQSLTLPPSADAWSKQQRGESAHRMTASSYTNLAIEQRSLVIFPGSQQLRDAIKMLAHLKDLAKKPWGAGPWSARIGIHRPSPQDRREPPTGPESPHFSTGYHQVMWWAGQDSNLQPDRYERPALTIELPARGRTLGVVRPDRHNQRGVQLSGCATGGMTRGRPVSSMATKVKVA